MKLTVYTGGPMPGKEKDWRHTLPELDNVEWLHPAYGGFPEAYFSRDVIQLKKADVLLAHFVPGYEHKGILTELGMAFGWNKPIILSAEYKEEHRYEFAIQCASVVVPSLSSAIDIIEFMSKEENYGPGRY